MKNLRFYAFVTETHPLDAVSAAFDMLNALKKLNDSWSREGLPSLGIRVGICTGQVICGDIGAEQHMEFTVIGNTVNMASRIESLNKELDTGILISESTFEQVKEVISAREHKNITIRGVSQPCSLYEPIKKDET